MVKFWAKRINYDITRIDEVPSHWREAVRELIALEPEPVAVDGETEEA